MLLRAAFSPRLARKRRRGHAAVFATNAPAPPTTSALGHGSPATPSPLVALRLAFDGECRNSLPFDGRPAEAVGPLSDAMWAAMGCFVSCALLGVADLFLKARFGLPLLLGSYGTLSVLFFAVGPSAALLRPWNIVAGHVCAASFALFAISCIQPLWLARAAALGATVGFMRWTGCVHPPGGAIVLVLMDSAAMQNLGLFYLVYPGLVGAAVIAAIGHGTDVLKRRFSFTWADIEGEVQKVLRLKERKAIRA